jgi:DNA polymerase-3 subunit gamma/tau
MSGDRAALRVEMKRIGELSVDYSGLLSELLVLWHDVAARQVLGDGIESELVDDDVLLRLAEGLSPEDVQLYYQLTLLARRDLDLAPDHRTGFEMAILRLIAFKPVSDAGDKVAPPVGRASATNAAPLARALGEAVVAGGRGVHVAPAVTAAAGRHVHDTPAAATVAGRDRPVVPASAADGGREVHVAPAADWFELVGRADLRGPSRELAGQLKPIEGSGARWKLALAPTLDSLNSPFARRGLEDALKAVLGSDCQLEIVMRTLDGETLAERSTRARADRLAAAERELLADPGMQALTREFGARVVPGSLQVD